MYGVNASDFPSARDQQTPGDLREARRLFYVGVMRPKKRLSRVYQQHHHSPWVLKLYQRNQQN
jgi:DNA helicase-2/ATP-dependent DNA helicase PcrA